MLARGSPPILCYGRLPGLLYKGMSMDRYLEVVTTEDSTSADKSCETLEQAGIPVLIQHVEITTEGTSRPGFTLLVPSQHCNQAQRLVDA